MYHLETMRSALGKSSNLPSYFVNESVNKHSSLSSCMDAVVDQVSSLKLLISVGTYSKNQVTQIGIRNLSRQAVEHSLPVSISQDLRALLIFSCHRVAHTRSVAMEYLNRLITSFPSLMCDPPLVFAILEVLTLLRNACEGEYTDEVRQLPSYALFPST